MRKSVYIRSIVSLGLSMMLIVPVNVLAQSDTSAATEESKTYSPLIEFISIQKSDNSVDLKTTVQAKIKGTLTKLGGLKIEFAAGADSLAKKVGEVITDSRGIAIFNCKSDQLATDAEGKLNFKASFAGKDSLEAAEEVLSIKRARLDITPAKEDSLLTVKLKLIDLSTGTETPVPETDLGLFVKRLFYPLKVGEGKTDEAGEAIIELPNNLPGDAKGNITLLGMVVENDTYGNLEAAVTQAWGTPVSDEVKELPRALWSSHPPLWMVITFAVLMTAVWGHYLVIIIQLFRLRKEEPEVT